MAMDERHGGELDRMRAAFPNVRAPWVDLSTGINSWPYPITDLTVDDLRALPTASASQACAAALANAIGAPEPSVLLSPGSELLIRLLPSVLNLNSVAILAPTYGDHGEAWHRAGAKIIRSAEPLTYADRVDAIVLCNPNNPDGRTFAPDTLLEAHGALTERGGYLIVDEAYAELAPELSLAAQGGAPGLIMLRSFGKFYGLAGLRLAAILAPADVKARLSDRLGVWPVSSAALEIGRHAYEDLAWQSETREKLASARRALDDILQSSALDLVGGTDLFRYVRTERAVDLWTHLAQQGIYVRKFHDQPDHLRIGLPKDADEMARLAEALSLSV
ncbi:MAG: threonine-phosphate decarboxylase CobD [Pseudomonadota bacterium]